jgi:poly(3-hydroxybutyrate) depolymerase
MKAWLCCLVHLTALGFLLGAASTGLAQNAHPLSAEERQSLDEGQQKLRAALDALNDRAAADVADAAIFAKGLAWGLRYDATFTPADVALMQKGLARGMERAQALAAGKHPWSTRTGKLALAYVSRIDGSVQPYGVIVPAGYDRSKPIRLDVVLHGSTRPVGLSELRFLSRFDAGDEPGKAEVAEATTPDMPYIELHPLGRVENCYRWAGETDVFEAIEDVCRRYAIDRDRIVLRGMSMGASGTWHLGLKHPDRFVALGPYCGYVDTHRFSETPLPTFVKVGPLPEHQELGLHMLDSVDYAANAGVVPAIACMGEKDVFFQAHVLMGEAMQREGLTMVNLISPGTGHVIDPVTHAEQMRRIGEFAARGLNHVPNEIRFITWTLKYSRCHWLEVLGLKHHYARAQLAARLRGETIEIDEPQNITRFAIATAQLPATPKTLRVGTTELAVPKSIGSASRGIVVARSATGWQIAGELDKTPLVGKRPGLQGPIDDAFVAPFVCVRGTGRPWNAAVQVYANASLERFAEEWRHYFRGEAPIKDDTAITEDDLRTRNLILFGDPGSNVWIARALPQLPLSWTKETLRFESVDYPSADHLPALIIANPLAGGEGRYLVLNSGHTFREAELAKLNYLLFPRWGDWAVLQVEPNREAATAPLERVVRAGYFDEQWKLPAATGP